jgi:hypothetical protein
MNIHHKKALPLHIKKDSTIITIWQHKKINIIIILLCDICKIQRNPTKKNTGNLKVLTCKKVFLKKKK